MGLITGDKFVTLKSKVKTELAKRNYGAKPLGGYAGADYDYTVQPSANEIKKEHYTKNIIPLRQVSVSGLPDENADRPVTESELDTMIAKADLFSTYQNGYNKASGCDGSCAGYCQTACTTTCGTSCNIGCNGCVASCMNDCTGGCKTGCNGCIGCSAACRNSCTGCYGCSGCGSGCSDGCSGGCKTGCKGCDTTCTGSCDGSCKGGCNTACNSYCFDCWNACQGCGPCSDACFSNCYFGSPKSLSSLPIDKITIKDI